MNLLYFTLILVLFASYFYLSLFFFLATLLSLEAKFEYTLHKNPTHSFRLAKRFVWDVDWTDVTCALLSIYFQKCCLSLSSHTERAKSVLTLIYHFRISPTVKRILKMKISSWPTARATQHDQTFIPFHCFAIKKNELKYMQSMLIQYNFEQQNNKFPNFSPRRTI